MGEIMLAKLVKAVNHKSEVISSIGKRSVIQRNFTDYSLIGEDFSFGFLSLPPLGGGAL
jgi:hypothetical protein